MRAIQSYRVTFVIGVKTRTIEIEAVGVLAAIREVRAMFPTASIVEAKRA